MWQSSAMKLRDIDKARYGKHFKLVFAAIAAALMVIAVGSSAVMIELVGNPGGSNFWLNLAGVILAAAVVIMVLQRLRSHPFMQEVVYVWDLKQLLNRIYRKESKLLAAVEKHDPDAMVIMNFFYRGSKQLYELDDNLITQEELIDKIRQHDKLMQSAGLSTSTDTFDPAMLARFE